MNKETIQGDWNILKGKIKEKWGKLTDDDLTEIRGKKDQLAGKLQKRYGYAKEMAEEEVKNWEDSCCNNKSCCKDSHAHSHSHSHSSKQYK